MDATLLHCSCWRKVIWGFPAPRCKSVSFAQQGNGGSSGIQGEQEGSWDDKAIYIIYRLMVLLHKYCVTTQQGCISRRKRLVMSPGEKPSHGRSFSGKPLIGFLFLWHLPASHEKTPNEVNRFQSAFDDPVDNPLR